jgi:hypothetical protein
LIKVVDDLSVHPRTSIPGASDGWAETKAAYRLLGNAALAVTAILAREENSPAGMKPIIWRLPESPRPVFDRSILYTLSKAETLSLFSMGQRRQHGNDIRKG